MHLHHTGWHSVHILKAQSELISSRWQFLLHNMLAQKRCGLSYTIRKALFQKVKAFEILSLRVPRDLSMQWGFPHSPFPASPNAMYVHFLEMGNAILHELYLMNILNTEGKNKQMVRLLTSDVNSRSQILFTDSRIDRKLIVYISYDWFGGKKQSFGQALIRLV